MTALTRARRQVRPAHVALMLAMSCALAPRLALAQDAEPAEATTEQARGLYVEGKDLRRKGELEPSLAKLEAAYALHPTAITALEVGRGRGLLGKLREAIEVLDAVEQIPVKSTDSDKAADARVEAKALAAEYRRRLAAALPPQSATAIPATTSSPPSPPELSQSTAPGLASPASGPSARTVVAVAGFGVGVVGLVVGATTGILTLVRAADIKPQCDHQVCPPDAGLDGAQTLGTVSTIAFVAAGVGAAVGAGALLFAGDRPEARKGAWMRLRLGIGAAALEGGF